MPNLIPVLKYPDPFLRRKADPVETIDEAFLARVEDMIETMHQEHGIGLAGTQVGWNARVAIVSGTGEPGDEIAIINPEILDSWGSAALEEGCLSFPGVAATITRARGITVAYTGVDGERHELEDDGMLGRCILHECDHLDGVTFLSKMTPADKLANRRAFKALEERAARRSA